MFVSSASKMMVAPATAAKPRSIVSQVRRRLRSSATAMMLSSPLLRPSAAGAVTDPGVTVHAVELSAQASGVRHHRMDEVAVAAEAILLHERSIVGGDLDRLLEVLQRERGGMAEAVVGLGHPLGEPVRGKMAVDAGGGVAMAALEPAVVLLVHDVAVDARSRIGREVGEALGVAEGEGADPDRDPDEASEGHDERGSRHRRASASAT